MKIKHYYYFKEKYECLDEASWDALRMAETETAFSIENTKEKYEYNCNNALTYKKHAEIINSILNQNGIGDKRIFSIGCGKAILEYHLKNLKPERTIKCTDYTKNAIIRLQNVFPRCDEFAVFDMLDKENYCVINPEDVVIMYRVSTELSDEKWRTTFDNLYDAGIKNLVFVPTEIASIKHFIREKARWLKGVLKGEHNTFCGWLYDEKK